MVEADFVARPVWLPSRDECRHGGNSCVEPERWALSVRQCSAFITACYLSSKWVELRDSKSRKEAGHVNLYQLCDHFVKPWTRDTGSSVALLMNNDMPLKAELMVSHSWGGCAFETLFCLLARIPGLGVDRNACGRSRIDGYTLNTAIWLCTLAMYQADDEAGPTVTEQLRKEPFSCVVQSKPPHGMLVLHTSKAEVYQRLWCVFEVFQARQSGVQMFCAYAQGWGYASMSKMQHAVGNCLKKSRSTEALDEETGIKVRSEEATCSSPSDEAMLRKKIEAAGGFQHVNRDVQDFRLENAKRYVDTAKEFAHWVGQIQKLDCNQKTADTDYLVETYSPCLTECTAAAVRFMGIHCLASVMDQRKAACDENLKERMSVEVDSVLRTWICGFEQFWSLGLGPPPVLQEPKLWDPSYVQKLSEISAVETAIAEPTRSPEIHALLRWLLVESLLDTGRECVSSIFKRHGISSLRRQDLLKLFQELHIDIGEASAFLHASGFESQIDCEQLLDAIFCPHLS